MSEAQKKAIKNKQKPSGAANPRRKEKKMELANMCYAARKKLDMSQSEFAKLTWSNQTEVSFIERGFIPSQDKVDMITNIYFQTKESRI